MENNSKIAAIGVVGALQEMNNPLTNIKLCVEMLEAGIPNPELYYEIMRKNTATMEKSIKELCDVFANEEFRIQLSPALNYQL